MLFRSVSAVKVAYEVPKAKSDIAAIMENLVGVEDAAKIDIIANDVEYLPNGKWTIKFRHPERCELRPIAHDAFVDWLGFHRFQRLRT